jgi:hypothetical protein
MNYIYTASTEHLDGETEELRSDLCKKQEECGECDWWFDEYYLIFRQWYTYYDHQYGGMLRTYEEIPAVRREVM